MKNLDLSSIDLMKFIMALCVVTIHTNYFYTIDSDIVREPLIALLMSAVPFFFMCSSYFVVKRVIQIIGGVKTVSGYIRKILRLYLVWSVITLIYLLIFENMQITNIGSSLYSIVFRGYIHLWYMWGLILIMPIVCLLACNGMKPWIFVGLAMVAYVFNKAYTHYGSMDNPGWLWSWSTVIYQGKWINITGICIALTYLSLGCFYALTELKMKVWMSVSFILLGMFMMHFEQRHPDVALGVPVIAVGLFPLIRDWQIINSKVSFRWLRNMSSVIYFIHGIIISIVVSVLGDMCFITWIAVIAMCIVVSAFLIWLRNRKGFVWLKVIM